MDSLRYLFPAIVVALIIVAAIAVGITLTFCHC